jgi:hypothetical protein
LYEYNPWAGLLPDLTADPSGDGVTSLPPMGGASPGIFDDLVNVGQSIISGTLIPVADFLAGKIADVLRQVWASTQGALNTFEGVAYQYTRGYLLGLVPAGLHASFPLLSQLAGFPHGYLQTLTNGIIVQALWNVMNQVGAWVRDRIKELLGFAGWGFGTMIDAVGHVGSVWANWTVARGRDFLGFAGWGFGTMIDAVGYASSVWAKWVFEGLRAALGFAGWGFGTMIDAVSHVSTVWSKWVADRIKEFLGFAGWGFGTMIDAVGHVGSTWGKWVADRIKEFLGFAVKGFGNMADFVIRQFQDVSSWIWNSIAVPIFDELRKIPGYIVAGAQDIFGFLVDALEKVLLGPIDAMVDLVEHKLSIPGRMLRGEYPDGFALLDDLLDPPPELLRGFTGLLILPFMIAGAMYGALGAFGPTYWEGPKQELLRKIAPTLLTPDDVQEAWNRELISEATAIDQLRRRGFGGEVLEAMQAMRFRLPGLSDLTRMAVREVFDPGQRSALTLDADYPGVLTDHARAIGLEEEWARNLWAAHWDLPSPTQGYEMLHRGIISEGQLQDLLRALDFAPVWRGRLQEISYNPLTRVDIRRMYAAGVISIQEVDKAYRDIGYNAENARRLTEFTQRNYSPDEQTTTDLNRALTASQIRTAYRRHIVTRDDAVSRLVEIGYDAEEADFQLALDDYQMANNPLTEAGAPIRELTVASIRQAYREGIYSYDQAVVELETLGFLGAEADVMLALDDLQLARDLTSARIALVRERYIGFTIDASGARAELDAAGVAPRRQDLLLAEWEAEAERGTRRLTVAEVFRLLARGVFNADQAFAYLLRLGYNQADADALFELRAGA